MAKSTPRTRRPASNVSDSEIRDEQSAAATAVEPPPAPAVEAPPTTGEDVGNIDAETNAKYEQVKGGKLYIKDLQTMDIHGLHDIAKQENIQDYVGLKKQDL